VTSDFGQNARSLLESFFTSSSETEPREEGAGSIAQTSTLAQSQTSRYRNMSILNELSQLNSVQRVSEILNSSLRQSIEQSLRQQTQNFNESGNLLTRSDETRDLLTQIRSNVPSEPSVQINARPVGVQNVRIENNNVQLDQLYREEMIEEISELVHRQLGSKIVFTISFFIHSSFSF
jgi:hypothetical protein